MTMSPTEISELIRNWAIVFGGAIGLLLAYWRGRSHDRQASAQKDQAEIALRTHTNEVFKDAVEQLGSEKLEVRLGAVYTLRRIANDFASEFEEPVLELLAAYARERSEDDDPNAVPTVDIREIVDFIQNKRPIR